MKGCAKFLNFIAFLMFLFLLIAFVAFCVAAAVIGFKPDIVSEKMLDALKPYTFNGQPFTMETLTGLKLPVLIIIGALIVILLLTLLIIANIRTALKEVGRGEPFSVRCSKALNTAALLEVISGIAGIAMSIYTIRIFGGASADGGTAAGVTVNLSFILTAAFLKMLAGVSEYGRR